MSFYCHCLDIKYFLTCL